MDSVAVFSDAARVRLAATRSHNIRNTESRTQAFCLRPALFWWVPVDKAPAFLIPPEGLVCRGERVRALLQDSRIVGPRVACVPYASVSERSSTVATMLAGSGEWRI